MTEVCRPTLSSETRTVVATAALEVMRCAGMIPDESSLFIVEDTEIGRISAIASSSQQNVYAEGVIFESSEPTKPMQALHTAYTLNGLIVNESGIFQTPASARAVGNRTRLRITSTPEGYNAAQRKLGRIPGVDVPEMTMARPEEADSRGETPIGQWVAGWAEGKVVTTHYSKGNVISHDLCPAVHGMSWPALRPAAFHKAVARAQLLRSDPRVAGVAVDMEYHVNGTNGLIEFGEGTEALTDATKPVFEAVLNASWNSDRADKIDQNIARIVKNERARRAFVWTGIVPPGRESWAEREAITTEVRLMTGYVAGLVLAAEEEQPSQNVSPHQRATRMTTLRSIATLYSRQ